MLIDAFPALNELDLARFRQEYLGVFVDKTLIFESDLTHSGMQKPLWFTENYDAMFSNRNVEVIPVKLPVRATPLKRERFTRALIVSYLKHHYPNDLFILSDLDEIPSLSQIQTFLQNPELYHYHTPTFFRYANWAVRSTELQNWSRGVFGNVNQIHDEQGHRFSNLPTIFSEQAGVHLSYLGKNFEAIEVKLNSFYHTEFSGTSLIKPLSIRFANEFGVDHLGRFDDSGRGILQILGEDDLGEIQRRLLEEQSHLFNFNAPTSKMITRLLASLILTNQSKPNRYSSKVFYTFISKTERSIMSIIISSFSILQTLFSCQISRLKRFVRQKTRIPGF